MVKSFKAVVIRRMWLSGGGGGGRRGGGRRGGREGEMVVGDYEVTGGRDSSQMRR